MTEEMTGKPKKKKNRIWKWKKASFNLTAFWRSISHQRQLFFLSYFVWPTYVNGFTPITAFKLVNNCSLEDWNSVETQKTESMQKHTFISAYMIIFGAISTYIIDYTYKIIIHITLRARWKLASYLRGKKLQSLTVE